MLRSTSHPGFEIVDGGQVVNAEGFKIVRLVSGIERLEELFLLVVKEALIDSVIDVLDVLAIVPDLRVVVGASHLAVE
jgi:hypothetical protein